MGWSACVDGNAQPCTLFACPAWIVSPHFSASSAVIALSPHVCHMLDCVTDALVKAAIFGACTVSVSITDRVKFIAVTSRFCSVVELDGRCSLCRGAGAVGWEGKWNHQEICPSCLGKRFVSCPSCGGHFHRPTFAHSRNKVPFFTLRFFLLLANHMWRLCRLCQPLSVKEASGAVWGVEACPA